MISPDVSFADMARRVLDDPELRGTLPRKPALNAAYRVVELAPDQIVIAGGAEMRSIRGRHTALFLDLVRALDGTATLEEVVERITPAQPDSALQAIAVLAYLGALEEGATAGPSHHAIDQRFCSRFLSVTRANPSGRAALARVENTTITLAGDPSLLAGLGDVFTGSAVRWRYWSPEAAPAPDELVVLVEQMHADHAGVVRWAHDAKADLLHVGIGRERLHWGPLWAGGRAGTGYAAYHRHEAVAAGQSSDTLDEWWRAFSAHQLFLHVARLADCRIADAFYDYDIARPWAAIRRHVVYPSAAALPAAPPLSPGAAEVLRHHGSVKMPPAELISVATHLHHYARQNVELAVFAPLGDRATRRDSTPLGESTAADVETAAAAYVGNGGRFPLPVLATALAIAFGYQGDGTGRGRRIAPTGGALCSPAAFLAVRDCEGVERGIYRYCWSDGPRLERWADLDERVLAGALGLPEIEAPAYVLVAGRIGRVMQKYQDFAFNIVHYDTGVAKAYLARVLSALGISCDELPGLHAPAMAAALGLPTAGEMMLVTAAVAVGTPQESSIDGRARDMALSALLRATSVVTMTAPPVNGGRVLRSATGIGALTPALLARRSVRHFTSAPPIGEAAIIRLLSVARDADRDCRARGALPFSVSCYAILNGRTTACASGLYSLDADGATLHRHLDLDADDVDVQYVNQRALGLAPIKLVTAVDLPALLERLGPAAYRDALLRAGSMVGSAWMNAVEHGLGGVAVGGFLEGAWVEAFSRASLGPTSTLLGFCCGRSAAAPLEH